MSSKFVDARIQAIIRYQASTAKFQIFDQRQNQIF
jgi:hypothetical protein